MQTASARPGRSDAWALALVVALAVAVGWRMRGMPTYSDERHHLRQIRAFCAGDFALDRKITMVPGYHLLSAAVGRAVSDCSLPTLRRFDALLGVLSAAAFLFAARRTPGPRPGLRALGYFLLPVVLPYHFLAYTDTVSLLMILLCVGLLLRGRAVAAGLVLDVSLLFRQTNVVWPLLVASHVFFVEGARGAAVLLRRLWPCLLGLVAFAGFVVWNGGVALGDAGAHRPGVHLGNVFFALLLFAAIFLPRALYVACTRRADLARPGVLLALAALGLVFVCVFGVDHAYNRFAGFLRNDLLLAADDSPALRAALSVPLLLAAFMLGADRLALPAYNLLLPVALLSLLPIRLVDQRYAFTALALYQLFRREDPPWLETAGLLWSLGLCVWVVEGLARGAFLL